MSQETRSIREWLDLMLEFAPKEQIIYVSDSFFAELAKDLESVLRYTDMRARSGIFSEIEYLGIKLRNRKHPERSKNKSFVVAEVTDETGE